MDARIISTPERDGTIFNNETRTYERRSSTQLMEEARQASLAEVTSAAEKAAKYGLSILTGRINLLYLRSDEVEEYVTYLQDFVLSLTSTYTAQPVFALYEKRTPTHVVDDVRDLTFNLTLIADPGAIPPTT